MRPTFEKFGVRLGNAYLDIADMSDRDLVAYEDKNERYFAARLAGVAAKADKSRTAELKQIDFSVPTALVQTLADAVGRSEEGQVQALLAALKDGKVDGERVLESFGEWQLEFLSDFGSDDVSEDYSFDEVENKLQLSEKAASKALDHILEQVPIKEETEEAAEAEEMEKPAENGGPVTETEMMAARRARAKLRAKRLRGEDYPWDQCVKDQLAAGHSQESAEKICGSIYWKYGPGKGKASQRRKAESEPDKSFAPSDALEVLSIPEFNANAGAYGFQYIGFGAFRDRWGRYWDYVVDGNGNRIYFTRDQKVEAAASKSRKAKQKRADIPGSPMPVFTVGQEVELVAMPSEDFDIPLSARGTVQDSDGVNYLVNFEQGPRWVPGFWLVAAEELEDAREESRPQEAVELPEATDTGQSGESEPDGAIAQRLKQSVRAEVARRQARARKDLQALVDAGLITNRERYASLLSTLSGLSETQYEAMMETLRAKAAHSGDDRGIKLRSMGKIAEVDNSADDNGYQTPLITSTTNDREDGLGLQFTVIGGRGRHLR